MDVSGQPIGPIFKGQAVQKDSSWAVTAKAYQFTLYNISQQRKPRNQTYRKINPAL